MEVVTSVREWKKGEFFRRHRHPGIDVTYVVQGSMSRLIVGDQPLKIFSVHIVDKGTPLPRGSSRSRITQFPHDRATRNRGR